MPSGGGGGGGGSLESMAAFLDARQEKAESKIIAQMKAQHGEVQKSMQTNASELTTLQETMSKQREESVVFLMHPKIPVTRLLVDFWSLVDSPRRSNIFVGELYLI